MNVIHATSPWQEDRCQPEETGHGTNWMLIEDPSDSMVIGGVFTLEDIRKQDTNEVWNCWTPGMKFRNKRNGKIILIYQKVKYKQIRDTIVEFKVLLFKEVKKSNQLELIS